MSSQNVLTAYARQSLYGFTAQACTILDQDAEFIPHWLNRAVHLRLKRVEVGINTRLLLDVPYSHHNCLLAGIGRMAWSIGQTPARRMLVVLHNVDCAEDFMEELARLLASPWYWRVFPGVQVFQYGERELRTSANSRLVITYVHGELPRGTVDQITLFKAVRFYGSVLEEVECEAGDWCLQSVLPLLNSDPASSVIVYNQRFGLNDLNIRLLCDGQKNWEHLRITAISYQDQNIQIGERGGGIWHHYRDGDDVGRDPNGEDGSIDLNCLISNVLYADLEGGPEA